MLGEESPVASRFVSITHSCDASPTSNTAYCRPNHVSLIVMSLARLGSGNPNGRPGSTGSPPNRAGPIRPATRPSDLYTLPMSGEKAASE